MSSNKKTANRALRLTVVLFAFFFLSIFSVILSHPQGKDHACANSISCISDLSGEKEATNQGIFMGKTVTAPNLADEHLYALSQTKAVLGDSTGNNKHIYVNLTNQRLYAYEGTQLIYDFSVSTGKWNPTPTGDFRIWIWLRYTRMKGGNPAIGTYYDLPNVPYTMYFWNDKNPKTWGYSLHGAYWHNNFGHPMSHGCVNMKIEDAAKIYYWTNPTAGNVSYANDTNPGTLITITGTAPKE